MLLVRTNPMNLLERSVCSINSGGHFKYPICWVGEYENALTFYKEPHHSQSILKETMSIALNRPLLCVRNAHVKVLCVHRHAHFIVRTHELLHIQTQSTSGSNQGKDDKKTRIPLSKSQTNCDKTK